MSEQKDGYEAWSILELMGHRRLGGFVREVQVAGAGFLRIDVPGDTDGETHSTQFYPPASVYCLTPVSEEAARIVAKSSRPQPVAQWEIPKPRLPAAGTCPGCKQSVTASGGFCSHCEDHHPCGCMDAEEDERRSSRRDYVFAGEGQADEDDFS